MPRLVASSTLAALRSSTQTTSVRTFANAAVRPAASSLLAASPKQATASRVASQLPLRSAFSTSARVMGGGEVGLGAGEDNARPAPDQVLQDIADYVHNFDIKSDVAYNTARLMLLDSLGCHVEALRYPGARAVLGPVVEGTVVPNGAKVPGTPYQLDPIRAAFNNGAMIRWLDFNDTWLAAEWGHPSDNLGSILAVADWLSRSAVANGQKPLTVHDVLTAAIKAHEIQGCLALENSFNKVGLDHVVLVKVASAAVVSKLLGNTRDQTVDVVSQAFVDGQSLRTYRHAPNAGSRKSWAAGDACSRAVNLALLVKKGEMGYNSVLTAKTWGFYDVLFKGQPFKFQRPYGSYVMENVLFKLVPAEFHAQTAVEAAVILNQEMKKIGKSSDDISNVNIKTQEAALRIICKSGPLNNYADRDHSISYMVSCALMQGDLKASYYSDDFAANPKIDELRSKTTYEEDKRYSEEYHTPELRSIGNSITLTFNDGSKLGPVALDFPVGHARRRDEAKPLIKAKLERHLEGFYDESSKTKIRSYLEDAKHEELSKLPVNEFIDLWVRKDVAPSA